jgi:hypothetical protein
VQKFRTLQFNDDYGVEIVILFDGKVTFGNKWGIGHFNVDELIDDASLREIETRYRIQIDP